MELKIDLTCKVSLKCMSADADSVGFQLACNVHVWAYFEKIPVSCKTYFYNEWPMVLGRTFLVVSDFDALFK